MKIDKKTSLSCQKICFGFSVSEKSFLCGVTTSVFQANIIEI